MDPAWLEGWAPVPFELRGGVTQVVVMGSGPPVLLLPPLPGFKESWLACAGPLSRTFRVITFDLRVRFDGVAGWDALVADVERVLDAFAPGAIGVVGHSLGGALAQRWALAHPTRVAALVLSSSFARLFTPPGHWASRFLEQPVVLAGQRLLPPRFALAMARRLAAREAWVYDAHCDDRVLDFVRFCIRDVPVTVARDLVRLAYTHDLRRELPGLRAPTLVVDGERESAFVHQSSDELMRLIAGAERATSPGVAHLHPFSGAEWLVGTLCAWIGPKLSRDRIDPSPSR